MTVMMACGHAANSTHNGQPACVICAGIDPRAYVVAEAPDLTGRFAVCGCGRREPSGTNLAFFEFRGDGSRTATICKCGYFPVAHDKKLAGERVSQLVCDSYEARGGLETDSFYCGCRGWD